MPESAADPIQRHALEADRMRAALWKLYAPVPSTKGMAPKDRAERLHAELERRISVAKEGLGL